MRQRNHTFDFLCGICIIIMVIVHTITFCGHNTDVWWKNIIFWTYGFICFFFFKAGYFSKNTNSSSREYIKDKAKRLIIPYISWGIIGFVIYVLFIPFEIRQYGHPIESMHWSHLWSTSSVWGNEPLWFLFSLFATSVYVHFINKTRMNKFIYAVQLILYVIISYSLWTWGNPLPLNLNNIFIGAFFFLLGKEWKSYLEKLNRKQALALCTLLIIVFIISNIFWHGEYAMSTNRFIDNPVAAIINMTIIMMGLTGLGTNLPLPRIPIINFIGEHSLVFFVAHYPLLQFYRLTHICFGHSIYGHWDDFIILLILAFCFCSWLVPYVESVPWLSGRFPKPQNEYEKELI